MPAVGVQNEGRPCADDIRAALAHMAESDAFRGSPQLVAFLRYVIEATLGGGAERIKGYTIAVEALGRKADFDPQSDPIVRVEAMRLRRALVRYYENGGSRDAVLIDLPLGSYVPVFRHNTAPPLSPAADPAPEAERPAPAPVIATVARAPSRRWVPTVSAAGLVLLGAFTYGALDFWFDFNTPNPRAAAHAGSAQTAGTATIRAPIFPLIYVGAIQAGDVASQALADRLHAKLSDALARFDEISVTSGQPPFRKRALVSAAGRYALTASVETGADGLLSVSLRLEDLLDQRIAFAGTFSERDEDPAATEEAIVREIAITLAQPYGIIYARERAHQIEPVEGDQRYRCLLDAHEYWRSMKSRDEHMAVRECLERAAAADPSLASAFASLSELALQEYRRGFEPRSGDEPALDRALQSARRGVEARPGSAYAHQALMDALFLRGEYTLSLEAGARAVALNPYHPSILGCYGARLVALGEIDKGARYLREAASAGAVRPEWLEFYLFLASYLQGDERAAASHAAQMTSPKFSLGLLAHTLLAARSGKLAVARETFGRLLVLQPRWRDGVEPELRRMFPADAVSDRLARDLAQVSESIGQ